MAVVNELSRFDQVRRWDNERTERGWWHSFDLPDGRTLQGVCSVESLRNRIEQFPIPQDLRGKRVLDIGAWDGWFSFEMERRGAAVLAIDNWDNPRFHEARAMLGSRVEYRQMDMYELTPERVGRFDIVLFMGVLYHLKHPLLALERVCALTTDLAAVDSFVLREKDRPGEDISRRPVMEFYESSEFGGQTDNWVAPSLACLAAFCRTAGFARVELRGELANSACFACYRHWESPRADAPEGPELAEVSHNLNHGINFDSSRDELVTAWFRWSGRPLGIDDVQPEVGGYGVRPIHVKQLTEIGWQTNFKLPPGLTAGWHEVSLRVDGSRASVGQHVAVDLPLVAGPIEIRGMSDSKTWVKGQLDRAAGDVLSVWIAGLPENVDRNNLTVSIEGRRAWLAYIGADAGGARQINVEVPKEVAAGPAAISVSVGGAEPASGSFEVIEQ